MLFSRGAECRAVTGVIAVLAAAATAAGALPAAAEETATGQVLVSSSSSRSDGRQLAGSTLSGNAYVFWNGSAVRSASFAIDGDETVEGETIAAVELLAPYDFRRTGLDGKALPLRTQDLRDGAHVLKVQLTETDGDVRSLSLPFVVENGESEPTPPASGGARSGGTAVIDTSFNSAASGAVTPKSFNSLVGNSNDNTAAYDSMSYVSDGKGGKAIRTKLAAGKFLGSGGSGRGNVLVVELPDTGDRACMSYDVRVSDDFDFSLGGKLPGLLGVAPGTSPSTPTGGGSTAHGWSARLMWVGPRAYSFAGEGGNDNMLVTYLYHPDRKSVWGDNVQWHEPMRAGRWHRVEQCHTMNTVGRADGVLEAWLDGQQVLSQRDVVYRTDPKVHVTHFDWSIFRGGNTDIWAGKRDGHVDVDNLKVTVS